VLFNSKFKITIFFLATLLVTGSAFTNQDAFAAVTFTAYHNTTTQTDITFSEAVNGTLIIADWRITLDGTSNRPFTDAITITGITNSSSHSPANNGALPTGNSNLMNSTVAAPLTQIFIHHDPIPSDATYNVNFTASETVSGVVHTRASGLGFVGDAARSIVGSNNVFLAQAFDVTADDRMIPIAVSSEKIGPKKIKIVMSEPVGNINSTGGDFILYGLKDSVVSSIIPSNGTNTIHIITQNLIDPINSTPAITLSYSNKGSVGTWITDAINSDAYVQNAGATNGAVAGHGNRLANFTGLSVFYPTDFSTDTERFPPHIHDEVSVSVNSDKVYDLKIQDKNTPNILAQVGDTVSVTISIGDDTFLNQISKSILITNYDNRPSDMNQYYSTNHNEMGQTGLSVYEWNQNTLDQNYDYAGIVSWGETIVKIDKRIETFHEFVGPLLISENELFITYSMTFDDVMPKSQVGIKISDTNYNNFESFLPFTLEVLPSDDVVTPKSIEEPIEYSTSPESDIVEITLSTNNDSYENGDKVIVTGQIQNYDFNSMKGKDIFYSVISPENKVLSSGQIGPNSNGSFYFTTFAMDNLWKTDGNYIFSVNLSSLKQTVDISYDNTQFESLTFESELEPTTPVPIIPEATTIPIIPEATTIPIIPEATTIPIIPEATTIPIIPEATTIPIIPEATSKLSNSNIICGTGTEDVNGICQVIQTKEKTSSGGGCLIATAAYGSEMSPQVQLLREIRDNQLMNTESGSAFMSGFNELYYSFSPIIADMERESPIFKEIVKLGLTPMLSSLTIMENANSESEVLGIGISVIMLNLGMYLGVPSMIVICIRKKF
jgi:hypothetical protein